MKKRTFSLKNWLLAAATGLLGINVGCHSFAAMYGTPWAEFEVKGRVTNQHGEPIQGISVSAYTDTVTSNAAGRYDLTFSNVPWGDIPLHVKDVDGTENGSYQDTVVNIPLDEVQYEDGDNDWYMGHATINQDIVLKVQE